MGHTGERLMCGIAGFMGGIWPGQPGEVESILRGMGDAIAHRGPDGEGYWSDQLRGVAFAHRRLAIIDLSPQGAQPMLSASGRYVVCYNGEIYNHRQLRSRLSSSWRGTSDTETLLAGFETWGIRATIEAAVGMFAFALWDRADNTLTLVRDRFGEKPLYYGWQGGNAGESRATFLFASELSALRSHPAFTRTVNRGALRGYMRFNNVGGTDCIYEGIRKLAPGCLLTLKPGEANPAPVRYWSSGAVAQRSRQQAFSGTSDAAVDTLEALLKDAISQQMVADVPVGAFLSGGVDSSTVAALMQAQASRPIRTFTIGLEVDELNEARHARAVAQHLRTDHTEMYVSSADALNLIPDLASIYSEPFADSSQIPTHLLARLTRAHVTVSLSGDCGDELFGGYNRYRLAGKIWRRLSSLPFGTRKFAAAALLKVPARVWDRAPVWLSADKSAANRWSRLGDKVQKVASLLSSRDTDDLHLALVSQWPDPSEVVIGGVETAPLTARTIPEIAAMSDVERMMIVDVLGYMNDDILTKVDRAAMKVSLETRVPMLDHRVAEFAWRLPIDYKLRDGQSKWILRQVLYRHVPRTLIERPKAGFAVPIDRWLREPLREWAEDLLSETSLKRGGYLKPGPIRQRWAEHLSGKRNWYAQLWNVLMFQAWLEHADD